MSKAPRNMGQPVLAWKPGEQDTGGEGKAGSVLVHDAAAGSGSVRVHVLVFWSKFRQAWTFNVYAGGSFLKRGGWGPSRSLGEYAAERYLAERFPADWAKHKGKP